MKLNCSDSKLRAAPFDSRFARTASNRLLRSSNEGVGALGLHGRACSQFALELVVAYSNPPKRLESIIYQKMELTFYLLGGVLKCCSVTCGYEGSQ